MLYEICICHNIVDKKVVKLALPVKLAGHVVRMRERGGAYMILVDEPGEKWLVGRRRRRWENNIKKCLS
jgi:hypothetical protein